ncbi:hypothetical protein B0E53_06794 [Micromonospora sp. MH33]|nr:hypothetical protein B0E53_06794 [Micromonospora sp. MH33]
MSSGHLTDRMTGQIIGRDTPRRQQLVQGHLDREQPRLRIDGLVQQHRQVAARLGEHHLPQRTVEPALEQGAHPIERLREHREPAIQVPAHAGTLRTLTGEQQRPPTRGDRAGDQAGDGPAPGQRGQARQQTVPARGDHHRPMLQGRPRGRQGPADVDGRQAVLLMDVPGQPRRLTRQGLHRPRRHQPRHHGHYRHRRQIDHGRIRRWHRLGFRRFEDHVRVRAGDTERRHRRPTRPLHGRPRLALGHQTHRARRPVHLRRGCVHVQRRRHEAVPHRQHHLDHARHTRRRLRVAEIRLHRPQQQRFVPVPPPPVRRQQRLRLDRITQRGTGTVRLHHVHIRRRQPRRRQRRPDHPLLRRTVRRRQPVRRPILVHRRTAQHGEDPAAVAPGVGEALHQQHADALAPAGAVGRVRERPAAPVRGEPALAGELLECARRGHHRDTAGQGQVTLAGTQRLGRQVQCHQRRRAGGVHGHSGPLEPEGVRHPTRQHARGGAGGPVPGEVFPAAPDEVVEVLPVGTGEDADPAAGQGQRVEPGVLDGRPGRLQQQPLLRVHGDGLAGRDAEELRVERARVVEEGALRHGRRQPGQVPVPVGREVAHGVDAVGEEPPELRR